MGAFYAALFTLCALCCVSASTPTEMHFFPFASVEVSQWTVHTLFQTYFAAEAHQRLDAAMARALETWKSVFRVNLTTPCLKANFATVIENNGIAIDPNSTYKVKTHVSLLPDRTLGMYSLVTGTVVDKANAWFVEGVCFSTDCECNGFPVEHLCTDALVRLDFNVSSRVRIDLSSHPGGIIDLPIVEVNAEIPTFYSNGCASMSNNTHLRWFARKFNTTFMESLQANFSSLVPILNASIEKALRAFITEVVQPAAARNFPSYVATSTGLAAHYRVVSTGTWSAATASYPGTPDDNAFFVWNATASFSTKGDDGQDHTYMPWANGPAFWNSHMPPKLATRITISTEVVQVHAWYSSMLNALNHRVNNTILDAVIETNIEMDTPASAVEHSLRPIPLVDASIQSQDVEKMFLSKPGETIPLLLTMARSSANVACRNGTLQLIEAWMNNLTTRTRLALQMDHATAVIDEMHCITHWVPSFFFWIVDFNHFTGAKYEILHPTGGFPTSVLHSMMQKALNETRPHINNAVRNARLPLPPAVMRLLRPLNGTSALVPSTDVAILANQSQGRLALSVTKPNVNPSPVAPPLTDAVPVVVGISNLNHTLLKQQVTVVGPQCAFMTSINSTPFFWQADVSSLRLVITHAAQPTYAVWPTQLRLLCTDTNCQECHKESVLLNHETQKISQRIALPSMEGLELMLMFTVILPQESQSMPEALCVQPVDALTRVEEYVLASTAECSNDSGNASLEMVSFSEPDDGILCIQLPGSSLFAAVADQGQMWLPCVTCPKTRDDVTSACQNATAVQLPRPGTNASRCISAAGRSLWLSPVSDGLICSTMRVMEPIHPIHNKSHWDTILWVCCIVILALLAGFVLWLYCQKNPAAATEATKNTQEAVFLQTFTPHVITLELIVVALVCFACALIFWLKSPFSHLTSERARSHGLPQSVDLQPLQHILHRWASDDAWILMAFAFACASFGVFLRVRRCCWVGQRDERHEDQSGQDDPQVGKEFVFTVFFFQVMTVAFQFINFYPPLWIDTRKLANVNLDLNVSSSIIDRGSVNTEASKIFSIGAALATLPVLLHLTCCVAAALPLGAGAGCALRAWIYTKYVKGHVDAFPEPLPVSWLILMALCSTCTFAVTIDMDFVGFEATREAAWLVLAVIRTAVGLMPIVSTQYLHAACKKERNGASPDVAHGESNVQSSLISSLRTAEYGSVEEGHTRLSGEAQHKRLLKRGYAIAGAALVLDVIVSLFMAVETELPSASEFTLHLTALIFGVVFFFNLEIRIGKTPKPLEEQSGTAGANQCSATVESCYRKCREFLARYSTPWWRLPMLVTAALLVTVTLGLRARDVKQNALRSDLIGFMQDNGIQFPKNISSIHLVVDPGIDAYQQSLRNELVPLEMNVAFAFVAILFVAVAHRYKLRHEARKSRMFEIASRFGTILSYLLLLVAALYFTIPDFVKLSNLDDVIPHCGPKFFEQGELLTKTFARVFFSSVIFGRLLPLLITFPPAVVRVLYLFSLEKNGSDEHFGPMLVATIVAVLSIQLPLTIVVLTANALSVTWVAAAFPLLLFLIVLAIHPSVQWRGWMQKKARLLALWWLCYIIGWFAICVLFFKANEKFWSLFKRLFSSAVFWFDILGSLALVTVAFCDVCLTVDPEEAPLRLNEDGAEPQVIEARISLITM